MSIHAQVTLPEQSRRARAGQSWSLWSMVVGAVAFALLLLAIWSTGATAGMTAEEYGQMYEGPTCDSAAVGDCMFL